LEKLSIIIGEERKDFFKEESLVSIFKSTVEKYPDKTALFFKKEEISYKKLDEWTDCIAANLQLRGLKKNTSCIVYWDRGFEIHVAILAILKCGATYVPLDYDMPEASFDYYGRNSIQFYYYL
jgi:acyl-CoA synthetase (AMP-forming)/AMP-acid ligase II